MAFKSTSVRNHARRIIKRQVQNGEPCCFCGQPIDLTIKYPAKGAFVVDHKIPTSHGGSDSLENLRPSHAGCNLARSNRADGSVGTNSGVLEP